jgi:hypothetical protein
MKTALAAILVLSSLNAFATTVEKYEVGAAYVETMQPGVSPDDVKLCPELKTALIMMDDDQSKSLGIQLVIGHSAVTNFPSTGSTQTCMSDIVCPTTDDYALSETASLMATRKNNGDYPTTDLPGHTDVMVYASVGSKNLACYYGLTEVK